MDSSVARIFSYSDVLEKIPIKIMKGKCLLSHEGELENLMVLTLWASQKVGDPIHLGVIYTTQRRFGKGDNKLDVLVLSLDGIISRFELVVSNSTWVTQRITILGVS